MKDIVEIARRVEKTIEDMAADVDKVVKSGSCKDYADYKRLTAMAEGMRKAGEKVKELLIEGLDIDEDEP